MNSEQSPFDLSDEMREYLMGELKNPNTPFERIQEIGEIARKYAQTHPIITSELENPTSFSDQELADRLLSKETPREEKDTIARLIMERANTNKTDE